MPGLARGSALCMAAIAVVLILPTAASADISGVVKTPRGTPVVDVSVDVRDSAGGFVDFTRTDATGKFTTPTSDLSGHPGPYVAKVSTFDRCDLSGSSNRDAQSAPANDGQAADITVDLNEFCNANLFSGAEGTAYIDTVNHAVLSPPGGTANLEVLAPSGGTAFLVTLQDGTPIGSHPDSPNAIPVTFPNAPYNGPIVLHFTFDNQPVAYVLGTLVVANAGPLAPATGNLDLEAIVDVSGSMSGTDPKFRRKDAVSLLLDLSARNDKIGAVGFDDDFNPIFDLTTISGTSVINRLKNLAKTKIVNEGGTNYNVAFDEAYKALTGPGVDPNRRKAAIFLTDGGHNSGTYNNGHLRFAINPSGHTWPVCVVQLGTNFQQTDVDRLKRIATQTGGQYVATPSDDQLTGLYFSCTGQTSGSKTVFTKVFTFKQGQTKSAKERLPKKVLPSATFFVNWGEGKYKVTLKDPKGKTHTPKRPGRGGSFGQGQSYAFYRIRRPIGGVWRMIVKAVDLQAVNDKASVKITVIPRKRR